MDESGTSSRRIGTINRFGRGSLCFLADPKRPSLRTRASGIVWTVIQGIQSMREIIFRNTYRLRSTVVIALLVGFIAPIASAEGDAALDAINQRLYQQLAPPTGSGKIETVSGQMYLSKENIDSSTISEALAAMLDQQQTAGHAVSIQRAPRINFEIHFPKNSADLTEESRKSLDELAIAISGEDYEGMRFMLGGHTDLDGDAAVNGPLSQARAETARNYLVESHEIPSARLEATGYGTEDPLRKVEQTAQDKLYNRRVDLRPIR